MKTNYIETKLGKCVTKYTHPLFDQLVLECTGFVACQLGDNPSGKPIMFEPKCGIQQDLYGLFKDSDQTVLLMSIVDSSD